MLEVSSIPELRAWTAGQRRAGRRIGFVPTMGFLHEGHLALVDEARRLSDAVVMSIFVNPLQFAPAEDLARYPRDLPRDRALAASRGVALLFTPDVATMYPPGAETVVVPGPAAARWEGAVRPGHFAGVLTVVAKLLNLVQPDVAVFGRKDIQQAALIRRMLRDLDWPVELAVAPTVREPDGLALSSRNSYLDPAARTRALALSRALAAAHAAYVAGERSAAAIERVVCDVIEVSGGLAADYIAVVDPDRLDPLNVVSDDTIVAVAARVGQTRLIDNIILGVGV